MYFRMPNYTGYNREVTDQYTKTLHLMPDSCNLRQIELCTNKILHKCEKDVYYTTWFRSRLQSPNQLSNDKLTL